MAYLYVWEPNEDSWGHAALLLRERNIYISWWPKDDKSKHKKKSSKVTTRDHLPKTYNEDVTDFNGRPATHRFEISSEKINCDAVASWWSSARSSGGYHLIDKNCCDIVYAALERGGCFDWVSPGIKVISTPRHMARYGRALESATSKEGALGKFKIL